jgi:hypothetical protein
MLSSRVRRPGGPQASDEGTAWAFGNLERVGAVRDPRRSGSGLALGEQEPAPFVRGAGKTGFSAGQKLVGRPAEASLGFSLQANAKTRGGTSHPDRDAQFEHINAEVKAVQAAGEPVISVDTKTKELVGDFKNGGRELRPKGQPRSRARSSGTSKCNRIEHKLFAFIANWRGKPLVSYLAIIQLIARTTTDTGLTVTGQLDANAYEKGIKVSEDEMASLNLKPASFDGEWNYTIAAGRPDG